MTEYEELRERDLMDAGVLYKAYKDYSYAKNKLENIRDEFKYAVSREEMKARINYILKNKINQRDEISTLCWILGEEDERKTKY